MIALVIAAALQSVPLVIEGVTLIDVELGRVAGARDVVVANGRIAAIADRGAARVSAGARRIDGHGKYLIPGLWDLHVHIDSRDYLMLLVSWGVTGVRDMGGQDPAPPTGSYSIEWDSLRLWRKRIQSGLQLGPRIIASGRVLDGVPPWPGTIGVENTAAARRVVDSLRSEGVDFIKVTNGLSASVYRAVAQAAAQRNLPFAGHVPNALTGFDASRAGQRSIEHLTGVTRACQPIPRPAARVPRLDGCDASFREYMRNGTAQVPTLVAWRANLFSFESGVRRGTGQRFVSARQLAVWDSMSSRPPDRGTAQNTIRLFLALVARMYAQGVTILPGSDAGVPYTVPGVSLHDELELLTRAGLTHAEVLRAATADAARYLGVSDSVGTIRLGKFADLVVLDRNPLVDIRNARRIAGVVVDGRWIGPLERQGMLRSLTRAR